MKVDFSNLKDTTSWSIRGKILMVRRISKFLMTNSHAKDASPLPDSEFERLVSAVYKQFLNAESVIVDEHLLGKSGTKQQIDIAIRGKVAGLPLLAVLECRDYKRPVSTDSVSELIEKIDEVGASKGVLISSLGFTEEAVTRANSDVRVHLASINDALDGTMRKSIPVNVKITFSEYVRPPEFSFFLSRRSADSEPFVPFNLNLNADKQEFHEFVSSEGTRIFKWYSEWSKNEGANLPAGQHEFAWVFEESTKRKVIMRTRFTTRARSFVRDDIMIDEANSRCVNSAMRDCESDQEIIERTWPEVPEEHAHVNGTTHFRRTSVFSKTDAAGILKDIKKQIWAN